MKIIGIQKLKDKELYLIKLDNDVTFISNLEDLIKYDIKEEKEYSLEEINQIIYNCEFSKAYNYSLYILGLKQYTTKEMINKLKKKGFSEQIIDTVVEKLKNYCLLDDEKYATKFIKDCLNKKMGTRNIKYKLISKGINIDLSVECINEETIYNNAKSIALKKLKSLKADKNIKGKLYQFLIYKGYENEIIFKVLREILNDKFEDGDLI